MLDRILNFVSFNIAYHYLFRFRHFFFSAKASPSPSLPNTLTVTADPKDSFKVTCGFTSKPQATISWTYNNGILPRGIITQPISVTSSGKKSTVTQNLMWNPDSNTPTRRTVSGTYICKGTVDLGNGRLDAKESQMTLNVECKSDVCYS